jgi:hypothetical protein
MDDLSGSELSKRLFEKYAEDITHNLSWGFELNYKGQAEQDIAANYASAMRDARYSVDNTGTPVASNTNSDAYRGIFQSIVSQLSGKDVNLTMGQGSSGSSTMGHTTGNTTGNATTSSSTHGFNWKARSKDICGQIEARGMKPGDFGCLGPSDKVRENFSWRGYTRMVCTRLGTVYDPSIPELCGCPPPSWNGWRP